MKLKQVSGEVLWGAGDSIHKIPFNATVDTQTVQVEDLKFDVDKQFLDDMLQDVFKAGANEAIRLAGVSE